MSHRVSILITNFNYGDYIGESIESALAVRHDDKEIIVVDDGSTDHSREVIERYRPHLTTIIYKPNGGQPQSANMAFAASTGDIILFLDSDDRYLPHLIERVIGVWRPGVSKVQFPMLNIDRFGRRSGTMFPNFTEELPPTYVRELLLDTALYPCPPTTGNAYSRDFLSHIFPVPEKETVGFDSFTNIAAPLYGDVITVAEPLAEYRIHGKNSWAQEQFDPRRLLYYIDQDVRRTDYLRRCCERLGFTLTTNPLNRNTAHLMFRMGSKRAVGPEHPVDESVWKILGYAFPAILAEHFRFPKKLTMIGWFLVVGLSPKPVAAYFLRLRFVSLSRPRLIIKVLRALKIIRTMPA